MPEYYIGDPALDEAGNVLEANVSQSNPDDWTIRSIVWQWDHASRMLYAHAVRADGTQLRVCFPLSNVEIRFTRELAASGIVEPPVVGEMDTVSGLFSRVKRAIKKAKKAAKAAVRRTTRAMKRRVQYIAKHPIKGLMKTALQVAPMVAMGTPIGGPALLALGAAKRANLLNIAANFASKRILKGAGSLADRRIVRRSAMMKRIARTALTGGDPTSALFGAALKSLG